VQRVKAQDGFPCARPSHLEIIGRGSVLRWQLDDAMARLTGANEPTMRAFYSHIKWTIEELRETYRTASNSQRKEILNHGRKSAIQMWNRGDWPWALGLSISCPNVESEHLPGEDAAYVKRETDKIIAEAIASLEEVPS
jgi:hypothetical protein